MIHFSGSTSTFQTVIEKIIKDKLSGEKEVSDFMKNHLTPLLDKLMPLWEKATEMRRWLSLKQQEINSKVEKRSVAQLTTNVTEKVRLLIRFNRPKNA